MERSATPWRVLESGPGDAAAAEPVHAAVREPASLRSSTAAWAIGGGLLGAIATFVLASVIIGGQGGSTASIEQAGSSGGPLAASPSPPALSDQVVVEVTGAVAHPGLYRLGPGARVADAVAAAGGYAPDLDAPSANATLNLAARIEDGDRVHVPSRLDVRAADQQAPPATAAGSAAGTGGASSAASPKPDLVNLNTATAAELDTLPGIGPATAAKILAAREEAPFTSVEDLRSRKLVTTSTFAKIQGLVTVP